MAFIPSKLYYKIGEVCEIVGVEAHVLRFWETEFPALAPPKSKNGQRTYRPGDIELILEIRKLLYEDGYTIAGARKRITMNSAAAKKRTSEKKAQPSVSVSKPVKPASPGFLPLFDFAPDKAKAAAGTESGGNSAKTGAHRKLPAQEWLKRAQKELENILTLLDRE